jgi:glycosyltransferase involved in cell wall biosynthesis
MGIPSDAIVIGGVGRLEARKNFTLFIDIASKLAKQHSNLFFAIFGDGPERQQLERHASKLLPANSWKFFGHLPNVDAYFTLFDILCYTSLPFEGMPNVIMEASGAGIPVVASAVDEVPFLVDNEKTGYLINDFEANSFVEGIINLIEDRNKCKLFGEAGKHKMQTLFSVTSMAAQMINLYTTNS